MSSSESDIYMVISRRLYAGEKLTGWWGFGFSKCDLSHSAAGSRPDMLTFDCGFIDPSLIWLRLGREVPCGIGDIPGTISRHSIWSPNIVGLGAKASFSVSGWTTARTINSDVPYFLSPSQRKWAASSHPGCVNSSIRIMYFSCWEPPGVS